MKNQMIQLVLPNICLQFVWFATFEATFMFCKLPLTYKATQPTHIYVRVPSLHTIKRRP